MTTALSKYLSANDIHGDDILVPFAARIVKGDTLRPCTVNAVLNRTAVVSDGDTYRYLLPLHAVQVDPEQIKLVPGHKDSDKARVRAASKRGRLLGNQGRKLAIARHRALEALVAASQAPQSFEEA